MHKNLHKRECSSCKRLRPRSEFYRRKATSWKEYRSRCKRCYQHFNAFSFDAAKAKARKAATYQRNKFDPWVRFLLSVNRAKRRGLDWVISFDHYKTLISLPCHYCGISVVHSTGGSLDRIDNRFGYIGENVITACGECNIMRGDLLTVEEMCVVAKALREFREAKCQQVVQ